MALTEHEHLGFSYNTEREKLKIPEYGRTLQQMVDYCVTIEDRDERNRAARRIIDVMGEINPHLRNVPDFQHKLWDQLFIMSDFRLDIDSPFPIPTRETFAAPPDRLDYPPVLDKYRYYGHYIRSLSEGAGRPPGSTVDRHRQAHEEVVPGLEQGFSGGWGDLRPPGGTLRR